MNFTSTETSDSIYIVRELWALRDCLLSETFHLEDVLTIVKLVDELINENDNFQQLKSAFALAGIEKSTYSMISLLINQITEIARTRVSLHNTVADYITQACNSADSQDELQIDLKQSSRIGDDSTVMKFEIKSAKYLKPKAIKRSLITREIHIQPQDKNHNSKRPNFNSVQRKILTDWIVSNKTNPYPTKREKEILCQQTGLSDKQLATWFTNNRKRFLGKRGNIHIV